jgi:integrase
MNFLDTQRSSLSSSTKNAILSTFRNVLKIAREEAVINNLPDTPRSRQRDNPRPFFRFYPLVSKEDDVYEKVKQTSIDMADMMVEVRGVQVTEELYDLILFVTHSFVRPITSELYAIRHQDVTVADNPRRLILTIRDGKTGYRVSNTMPAAVSVYERIKARYPDHKPEDFIFLPTYTNRITAGKIIQRQFKLLMERANIHTDPYTGLKHSIYSLRHTAICMRIILSEGKVNIFNLAKNAGTSVDQIERFYARHLPLSAEMARNLHSFGG